MEKNMNKHLNLFHHYNQSGSIPIENNISRGLAIILQEEPGLLIVVPRIKTTINIKIKYKKTDGLQVNKE
jgi:hypothetical protein